MDVLTDVLRTFRCPETLFCRISAHPPWGMSVPDAPVAAFRVVRSGVCWMSCGPHRMVLRPGDLVLLPHGTAHQLASGPEADKPALAKLLRQVPPEGRSLCLGDGRGADPAPTEFLCGGFEIDPGLWNPLRMALPIVLHLPGGGDQDPLVHNMSETAFSELIAPRVGSDGVLTRLAELILIAAVRSHLGDPSGIDPPSWLLALEDPTLHRSIEAIHRDLARPWTLDELARTAGMSRSSFTQRFRGIVGISPIQYLARWRMQEAAQLLDETTLTTTSIAERIGYASEAAFRRAFKAATGTTPAQHRVRPRPEMIEAHTRGT